MSSGDYGFLSSSGVVDCRVACLMILLATPLPTAFEAFVGFTDSWGRGANLRWWMEKLPEEGKTHSKKNQEETAAPEWTSKLALPFPRASQPNKRRRFRRQPGYLSPTKLKHAINGEANGRMWRSRKNAGGRRGFVGWRKRVWHSLKVECSSVLASMPAIAQRCAVGREGLPRLTAQCLANNVVFVCWHREYCAGGGTCLLGMEDRRSAAGAPIKRAPR